jgi:hypothetical protein
MKDVLAKTFECHPSLSVAIEVQREETDGKAIKRARSSSSSLPPDTHTSPDPQPTPPSPPGTESAEQLDFPMDDAILSGGIEVQREEPDGKAIKRLRRSPPSPPPDTHTSPDPQPTPPSPPGTESTDFPIDDAILPDSMPKASTSKLTIRLPGASTESANSPVDDAILPDSTPKASTSKLTIRLPGANKTPSATFAPPPPLPNRLRTNPLCWYQRMGIEFPSTAQMIEWVSGVFTVLPWMKGAGNLPNPVSFSFFTPI